MSTGNLQILYYIYAPNSTAADFAEKSKTHLDEHVVWIKACAAAGTVRYGGAILTDDQKLPLTATPGTVGHTYIVKADDLAAARKFFEQDPYYKAGLFDNANIKVAPILSKA
ncbi:hypothetical protein FOMPIDRAFT_1018743 [Fomitopsis schrenkii]|uniref:YCII-related domain-containing protein n=1 Tax=Fomitopsis schrenkii TaxID=2126942 RepID=S8F4L5_FOMSC|nr:hypothetical protein FOMPIDRAFT_1018743 [Fomitopsis schrenkii]